LRRSELLGLQWADVDLDRRLVSIRRTLHHVPHQGLVIYPPKNQTSARDLALSDSASLIFRAMRDRREADSASLGVRLEPSSFVFSDAIGKPLSPNTLSTVTKKIAARVGMPSIHLHEIRHWAASLALANGATLQEVQHFLGHSTIRVTADVYGHLEDKARSVQAERMETGIQAILGTPALVGV
jgi:integrase